MNIAIMQSQTITIQHLSAQMKFLKEKSLVIFNEYVLDNFYNELEFNKNTANENLKELKKISRECNIELVIPLILPDPMNSAPCKNIAYITPKTAKLYLQQKLISYPHWNENSFFGNEKVLKNKGNAPLIFTKDGIKFGAIFGYEIHFDYIFAYFNSQNVDVVILTSACAFDSLERWLNIAKARAFCNSMVIIQANRTGNVFFEGHESNFYGKSFVLKANGELLEILDSRESMLCFDLKKEDISNIAREWNFRKNSNNKKDPVKNKKAPKKEADEKYKRNRRAF